MINWYGPGRVARINPSGTNLYFVDHPISLSRVGPKSPFDPVLSAKQPPQIVEHGGNYYIFQGNCRFYAARTDPQGPSSIEAVVFTLDEFAAHSGLDAMRLLAIMKRATPTPTTRPWRSWNRYGIQRSQGFVVSTRLDEPNPAGCRWH
jgi:hypothetical protein